MSDAHGHNQDDAISAVFVAAVQISLPELVSLVYRVDQLVPVELQSDMSFYHLRLSKVGNSHLKILVPVFFVNDGLLTEDDSPSTISRPGDFGKDQSEHYSVDEYANQTLNDKDKATQGAAIGHVNVAVANGDLGLEGEEKGGVEIGDIDETGTVVRAVAINKRSKEPDAREEEPGENVRRREDEYHQPPGRIDDGGKVIENVAKVVTVDSLLYHLRSGCVSIDNPHILSPTQVGERQVLERRHRNGCSLDRLSCRWVGVDGVAFNVVIN